MKIGSLEIPAISDEDIEWVVGIMKLPNGAFEGDRCKILKELSSVDIQACPGSGKTTLLVAKLAILAKRWPSTTQGICVLSHTNVARQEIQERLGHTPEGQKLLSYPHFIGTIHHFVNHFIALPWMRSKGISVLAIQDDVVLRNRTNRLPKWLSDRFRENSKNNQDPDEWMKVLRSSSIDGEPFPIPCGKGYVGKDKPTYKNVKAAIEKSMKEGFFTFDEIFLFADEALTFPQFEENVQARFAACFIDEAQDCDEAQNTILAKLFPIDCLEILRQRFGDGNQAIFNSTEGKAAVTDFFPANKYLTISDSLRFNERIADLADPLGLKPYQMKGRGGKLRPSPENIIFLYDESSIEKVLPAYGKLLLNTFSNELLLGKNPCYAVGQVHKLNEKLCVRDYWVSYSPEGNKPNPNPRYMSDYFKLAIDKVHETGEVAEAVNLVALGIVKFLQMSSLTFVFSRTPNPHRRLTQQIQEHETNREEYSNWLLSVIQSGTILENHWNSKIRPELKKWIELFAGESVADSNGFLAWNEDTLGESIISSTKSTNIYTYEKGDRKIDIHLGSIHSVKGQTHLSTLVLDTIWYDRPAGKTNLTFILDWLSGTNNGKPKNGAHQMTRLKCHYVAMTRPSDLVCLALNKSSIDPATHALLESNEWRIINV